ncbi:S-layer homology domain-containing protein [Bacillus sp. ISL-47]|uniref:S-layer homology domain-containing protein n=1 Tax=Bacillus sp. ISL-47 TaxID=2819130 RepID=UPI001BE91A38|nr:S-layer homology domain-containing protein [Bacillus sp. ISL-47]MBT2687094.1 S-layer homology domain-containing protein [Bacillus sp. ISL-47]MBT2711081.1 S-layer homology domain-containing protein [Pseudomonas sp. ISL-84]
MKRILLGIVTVFLFLAHAPSTLAADDITGHYYENDMRVLIAKDILGGYGPDEYRPDQQVTRAEFAALVVRSLELQPMLAAEFSVASSAEPLFKDVNPENWHYAAVDAAVKAGIVGGYPDDTFKPNANISRQEMAAMIMRAINTRNIFSETVSLDFKDNDRINPIFKDAIQRLLYLGVMSGNSDGTFGPKTNTTRGQTAAVLNRMLKVINPPQNLEFKVASIGADGTPIILREFDSFATAKGSVQDNQVVLQGNNIVYMKTGVAAANKFTIIYDSPALTGNGRTYVNTGTELRYFDATETSVKIQLGSNVGYVARDNVNLIPNALVTGRSYYKRVGGDLYHNVYNPVTNSYTGDTLLGKAPSFMTEGQKYYSWDGINYSLVNGTRAGEAYTYFTYMPLHTKTNYTAEDIDKYLTEKYPDYYKSKFPESPLAGTGKDFKEMEAKYEVNALYLMAHAIHESAWGTSAIAQDKKNLFGMKAYDSDAYGSATTYESFRASIEDAAKYVTAAYQAPKGSYYNGAILGNKSVGMNVKYASDPYWGERIAGHMYRADSFLGSKDNNAYKLASNTIDSLNVRSGYGTSFPVLYAMKIKGIPFVYTETAQNDGSLWYQIISDDKNNRAGFVYGSGSLGQYVKEMPLAK